MSIKTPKIVGRHIQFTYVRFIYKRSNNAHVIVCLNLLREMLQVDLYCSILIKKETLIHDDQHSVVHLIADTPIDDDFLSIKLKMIIGDYNNLLKYYITSLPGDLNDLELIRHPDSQL